MSEADIKEPTQRQIDRAQATSLHRAGIQAEGIAGILGLPVGRVRALLAGADEKPKGQKPWEPNASCHNTQS